MYWIVDEEVNDEEEDWDKEESERGDGMGEGAQLTEFFVAAMPVEVQRARLTITCSRQE